MIRLIQGMSLPYAGKLLINRRKFSLDIEARTDTFFFFPVPSYILPAWN